MSQDVFIQCKGIPASEVAMRAGMALQQKGKNQVGLCPLHQEDTPSCTFYPDGSWYCYGCGKGGDAVEFQAAVHQCDPVEAARQLLEGKYSIVQTKREEPPAKDYTRFLQQAQQQIEAPEAVAYLEGRGISPETAKRAGAGYCPTLYIRGETAPALVFPAARDGSAYCARRIDTDDPQKKAHNIGHVGLTNAKALQGEGPVFVTEGCFDMLSVMEAGGEAVSINSASNIKRLLEALPESPRCRLLLCLDNDSTGQRATEELSQSLEGRGVPYSTVALPGGYKDANAALQGDKGEFQAAVRQAMITPPVEVLSDGTPIYEGKPGAVPPLEPQEAKQEEKEPKTTQADLLLQLVKVAGATFFQSETDDLYATLQVGNHTEILPLDGRDFSTWLNGLYYKETEKPIGGEAIKQAVAVLSAIARFDSPEPVPLATRTAGRGGTFWYDLTNPTWQAVEVTPEGWTVRDNPPIMFTRYRHQAAQSAPQPGGDIRKILQYVNVKGMETLFLCWLVSSFVPDVPHPMPIFYGEKGAAKSTTCALLKALIDPSALETMTLQNDMRTLAVNLQQHWFLPFDNVSHINEETSDTLCRAITGGGIQQRKLFTNSEDVIFTFVRCLALNGINNVATRPDLLDRSLLIELERITEGDRRELAEVKASFEVDRAAILGGILDTLSRAMKLFPSVKLTKLPRMADFARWGYAIGEALGGKGQEFLDQYAENRQTQNTEAINSDPVATLIVAFMDGKDVWEGLVSKLLNELRDIAGQYGISSYSKAFPSQPNQLSRRLRGMKSNLESVGIQYENHGNGKKGTFVTLRWAISSPPPPPDRKPLQINAFDGGDKESSSPLFSPPPTTREENGGDGGDAGGSAFVASPPRKPLQINACDDGGGSGDKFTITEEAMPWD